MKLTELTHDIADIAPPAALAWAVGRFAGHFLQEYPYLDVLIELDNEPLVTFNGIDEIDFWKESKPVLKKLGIPAAAVVYSRQTNHGGDVTEYYYVFTFKKLPPNLDKALVEKGLRSIYTANASRYQIHS